MKILITGAAGFVGINLSSYLMSKGHEVVGVDLEDRHGRLKTAKILEQPRFSFKPHDLARNTLDVSEFNDIEAIFHLAALPHVDYSYFHPRRAITNNLDSLLTVIELACKINKPLILSSSVEVYGGREDKLYTEKSTPAPLSPYAASKVASESIIQTYIETQGLQATILRFTNLYGPWQAPDRLVPRVIAQLLSETEITIEKGTHRDFVFVEDACHALEKSLNLTHSGEIFNLSSGIKRDNYEAVESILLQFPSAPVNIVPSRRHDGRGKYLISNPGKIQDTMGWRVTTSLSEGMATTVEWYRHHPEWLSQFAKNITSDRATDSFLTDANLHLPYW